MKYSYLETRSPCVNTSFIILSFPAPSIHHGHKDTDLNSGVDFRVEPPRYSFEFSLCQRFFRLTTANHITRPVASLKFMAATKKRRIRDQFCKTFCGRNTKKISP